MTTTVDTYQQPFARTVPIFMAIVTETRWTPDNRLPATPGRHPIFYSRKRANGIERILVPSPTIDYS